MIATLGMYLSVVIAVAITWYLAKVWYGRDGERSRGARGAVAAAPEPPPRRLADIIEDHGALVADVKNLRREWADFEKSWERRWGTLTRAARRDRAQEVDPESVADSPDPAQSEFPLVAPPPTAAVAGERRHLRPARLHLGQ